MARGEDANISSLIATGVGDNRGVQGFEAGIEAASRVSVRAES